MTCSNCGRHMNADTVNMVDECLTCGASPFPAVEEGSRMSTVKALVVTPDGVARVLSVDPALEALQGLVGGWLEAIGPSGSDFGVWHAYVNEEPSSAELPNLTGSAFARAVGWRNGATLRGTVVFLGSTDEGDEADVPVEVLETAFDALVLS